MELAIQLLEMRAFVKLHTHTHSPKRLAHPRPPIPPLSTLTARATHARPLDPAAMASVPSGIIILVRVRVRRPRSFAASYSRSLSAAVSISLLFLWVGCSWGGAYNQLLSLSPFCSGYFLCPPPSPKRAVLTKHPDFFGP
jgi:hypothetical protein